MVQGSGFRVSALGILLLIMANRMERAWKITWKHWYLFRVIDGFEAQTVFRRSCRDMPRSTRPYKRAWI